MNAWLCNPTHTAIHKSIKTGSGETAYRFPPHTFKYKKSVDPITSGVQLADKRVERSFEMESIMYAVSIFAGILTTASFMPQAIKTIRTKNTRGISLIMYIVLIAGLFMWFVYGVYLKNVSIIFSNLITLIFASVILVMKIRYK